MPKLKTSRSAAKRFSTTGSGKFRRRRQALRHILTKKGCQASYASGTECPGGQHEPQGCQASAALRLSSVRKARRLSLLESWQG